MTAKSSAMTLERLERLAQNLHWTWNSSAQSLFAAMDPPLWNATRQNPIKTLNMLSPERRNAIASDPAFAEHLASCERDLASYLKSKTWFDGQRRRIKSNGKRPVIAYFCAEFAIHESLPQYSGGLGVLAGDHVKSASDLGVPLVGIGLLYRNGFYTQEIRRDGATRVIYPQLNFDQLPINDTGCFIDVPMGRRAVSVRVWEQTVGRVTIYLLDADVEHNAPADRALTRHLYGGDREYRIQQEILLGVGGTILLKALGLRPTVYHLNEGHAAFAALERLRQLRVKGVELDTAIAKVRAEGVFTTHTPVPAGNDRFAPKLALKYLQHWQRDLNMTSQQLLGLGRENPDDAGEEFCMTVLALRLSGRCNGVAALHGDTSRGMWRKVYNAERSSDVPIGHVTNGVHSQTWLAPEIEPLYGKYVKPKWTSADWSAKANRIPPVELWRTRNLLRRRMIEFVRQRLRDQAIRQSLEAPELIRALSVLDENALTIGFARRFATYKRAPLIFRDTKRLARILSNPKRPVQLIFAGKAHPQDIGGQEFAQEIARHAHTEIFRDRVVLLEDYDMQMGRMLISGCDVWLNNPLRPQEASGTSGMKPPLHGGINCSILDGWWPEAYNGRNGWAIGDGREFKSRAQQDRYDADCIYDLLENKIVPMFYDRNKEGVPKRWVATMIESVKTVCGQFSSHRMVSQYVREYYLPAHVESTGI